MINVKTKVKNTYTLELTKPDGEKKVYVSHNAVLDNYFTHIIQNNAAPNLNVIRIGQGTDPVQLSQTTLVSSRASYSATVSDNNDVDPIERTLTLILQEGVLTGNISEVGLSNTTSGSVVYTRSLITDAEDNPITIIKEEFDILTITVKVYYVFDANSLPPYATWVDKRDAAIALKNGNAIIPTSIQHYYTRVGEPAIQAVVSAGMLSHFFNYYSIANAAGTRVSDLPSKTIRINGARFLASSNNFEGASRSEWPVKTIGNSRFLVDVQNSGIFPPFVHQDLELGIGDGITTGFEIPLVHFDDDDVLAIYIDGVEQDPATYTVNSKTFNNSLSSLPSADLSKVVQFSGSAGVDAAKFTAMMLPFPNNYKVSLHPSVSTNASAEIIYEFPEPITITHMFRRFLRETYKWVTFSVVNLYKFVNDDWELIYDKGTSDWSTGTSLQTYELNNVEVVSKVKLQITCSIGEIAAYRIYDPTIGFGTNTKPINFNNPPEAGLKITADVRCKVPVKNQNFNLGSSLQMKFERG